ncbi:hypothetical protein R6Q57_006303 [Mikania cordata]
MDTNSRSMGEGFDWMFTGQNPNTFAPASATGNIRSAVQDHRYSHQHPPPLTTNMGSSNLLPATANGSFPAMRNHLGANQVQSILGHSDWYQPLLPEFREYNPYDYRCNSCHPEHLYGVHNIHPGVAGFDQGSSLNGFLETLISDQNLEVIFNRLNISSPTNQHCSRKFNRVLDQKAIRSRDWVGDYPNPNHSPLAQLKHQPKRNKFSTSLKDLRGKMLMVAMDQEGCQFLQTKCEEGNPEHIEMIFDEIKDHICELMTDSSMNYLAQKLFKVCTKRQLEHIVLSVVRDADNLTNICLNSHGTRAMQKLIELVTTADHRNLIVSALRRITVTLTKNMNGHHVIQHCLKSFHVGEVQPILKVVADNCLDIATDKSGCCVLQQCVLHAVGLPKERLMTEIIENALHLAEHPYGNYVVQHILGMQVPDATSGIVQRLAGNFVYLAMNKYGSNVVEKCLKDAPDDQSMPIIREIINNPNFLLLLQHPFGNYVAQSALQTAKVWFIYII